MVLVPWNQQPFGITLLLPLPALLRTFPPSSAGPVQSSQLMTEEANDVRTE
jgi:hypothetical protein